MNYTLDIHCIHVIVHVACNGIGVQVCFFLYSDSAWLMQGKLQTSAGQTATAEA